MFFVWALNRCVPIGTNDHTLGVEAWKALYQSIRSTQDGLSMIAGQYQFNSECGFSIFLFSYVQYGIGCLDSRTSQIGEIWIKYVLV